MRKVDTAEAGLRAKSCERWRGAGERHDSRECTRGNELHLSRCNPAAVEDCRRERGPGTGTGACGAVAPQRARGANAGICEPGACRAQLSAATLRWHEDAGL